MKPRDEAFVVALARRMHAMYHEGATVDQALEVALNRIYAHHGVQRRDNWRHRLYARYARRYIVRAVWGPANCGTDHDVVVCHAG